MFQVPILAVEHGASGFPARLDAPILGDVRILPANDSTELKEKLKAIFQSPEVRRVIAGLLAQSKASARQADAAVG
jgi:hypothetical protein